LKRSHGNAFSHNAKQNSDRNGEHQDDDKRQSRLGKQRKANECAEHCHLALCEVDDVGGLIDKNEGEGQKRIDAAKREA